MEAVGRPALKLLIRDIQYAPSGFVYEGINHDRAWIQGTVKQKIGSAFKIDDGTGDILVAITQQVQDVAAGDYALVIGKLVTSGKSIHLKAHKVVNLSAEQDTASARMIHWNTEVLELQRKVYPSLDQKL